ncbi:RluA family pseudouridine synthase [Candidatus Electronema sp. JM]|uniref:RluA family pseudouridine synthase n=1 Tax=Candidatus Electronema sp. JM TaxID=3401571 RepID=UPI003AA81D26
MDEARSFLVQPQEAGLRLDHYLVRQLPEQSRSSLDRLIRTGSVLVNGAAVKPGCKLRAGDSVSLVLPPPSAADSRPQPQQVDFHVIYEDEYLAVISKPPGLVVHPAAGHSGGTLVNGLLHRYSELELLDGERPGLVHRLDKDTSGIMLAARTETMHRLLSAAFKERHIRKTYHALLLRSPAADAGRIDAPIARHPVNRQKMAVRQRDGRHAVTNWRILERFRNGCCFAEIAIETGRTHQIRVHMSSIGAPVLGDTLYGGKSQTIQAERQLLHASELAFIHPATDQACRFTAPLWPDMQAVLDQLREQFHLA